MREKATITEIKNNQYTLKCDPNPECKSCVGNSFCKVSEKLIPANNPKKIDLHIGDRVFVGFPEGTAIKVSFLVLILPLILFIIFFLSAEALIPGKGPVIPLLAGLGGFAGSFALTAYLSGKNKKQLPSIEKKIEEAVDEEVPGDQK